MILALFLLADAPRADANCGDVPQQPLNLCLRREFERVDAEMNAQWRITSAAMKAADYALQGEDRQPEHPTLLAAQRAWLTYRDRHCLGESFGARDGTLQPTLDSVCKIELTKERIRQLKALVDGET